MGSRKTPEQKALKPFDNPYRAQSKVNPQREDGRREINNEIWHALTCACLSGSEYQVVFTVLDRTWGFGKQSGLISLNQFEESTKLTRQGIIKAVKRVEDKHIVVCRRNGTKGTEYLFNKHYDTWDITASEQALTSEESGPQSEARLVNGGLPATSEQALTSEERQLVNGSLPSWSTSVYQSSQPALTSTSKQSTPATEPVKKIYKETFKEIYIDIFDHWNIIGSIKHKVMTDKMKTAIKSAFRNYSKEEITQAMSTYGEIINSDDYYFTHKWTLEEFFRRGLDKFMDAEVARRNYLIKEDRLHGPGKREGTDRSEAHRGNNKAPTREQYIKSLGK